MKKLLFILVFFSLFSCKDEEPKSIIIRNGLDHTKIRYYKGDMEYMERVLIMFYDEKEVRVRTEIYPVLFYTVKDLYNGYQVANISLEDKIKYMIVVVEFYWPDEYINLDYTSEIITINEGMNVYTISEYNSTKWPNP